MSQLYRVVKEIDRADNEVVRIDAYYVTDDIQKVIADLSLDFLDDGVTIKAIIHEAYSVRML